MNTDPLKVVMQEGLATCLVGDWSLIAVEVRPPGDPDIDRMWYEPIDDEV